VGDSTVQIVLLEREKSTGPDQGFSLEVSDPTSSLKRVCRSLQLMKLDQGRKMESKARTSRSCD